MTALVSTCYSSQQEAHYYRKTGVRSGARRQKHGPQSAGRLTLPTLCLLFCCCAPLNAQHVPRFFLDESSPSGDLLDPDLVPSVTIKNVDDIQQLYQVYRNLRSVCKDCDPARLKNWISSYYSPQMPTRSMPSMSQFAPGQNSKSPKAAWYLGRRKRESVDDYNTDDVTDDSNQVEVDPSLDKRSMPDFSQHPCLRPRSLPGKTLVNLARLCQIMMPRPAMDAHPFLNGGSGSSASFSKALAFVRLGRREQNPTSSQPASRVRSRSASGPVSWYLGKRSPLANWYLGKRMTASAPFARYIPETASDTATWYLGKRSAGPVSWYLGKRSGIDLQENDQLDDTNSMLPSWSLYKRSSPTTTWYLGRRRR